MCYIILAVLTRHRARAQFLKHHDSLYVCEIQVSTVARSHRLRFAFGRSACGFHESASGPDGARLEEASARGRKGREDDHASSRLGSGRLDSFVAESGTADKKHKWSGGTRGLCSTCNRGGNGLPPELGEGRPTSSEGKTSTPDNSPDREPCSTDTDVPGTLTATETSVGEWERELETERKEVTTDRTTDRKEVASSDAVDVCVAGASSDAVDECVAGASSDAVDVCVVGGVVVGTYQLGRLRMLAAGLPRQRLDHFPCCHPSGRRPPRMSGAELPRRGS